jgi:tetratricopeptide (TPR) repeat protein
VDSAKSWDLTNAILKGFGSSLVPGRSRVVLEDFRYAWAHCLPLIFDSRPDLWEEIESVDQGPAVTFRPLKRLDGPAGVQSDYSDEAFPLQSAERLLRSRIARENPLNQPLLEMTLYRKYLVDGPLDEARNLREEILAKGIDSAELAALEDVNGILVPCGWKAYTEGNFENSRAIAERCLAVSGRSEYALTLLGFSLWRLGCLKEANDCIDEILSRLPDFPSALLFRAEVGLREQRYGDVESDALRVLRDKPSDETTIAWTLNVLSQAWNLLEAGERRLTVLHELADSFSQSPSFQAALTEAESAHAVLAESVPPEAVLTGAVSHETRSDDR